METIRRIKKQIDKDRDVLNSHLLQQMREKMNKENLRANDLTTMEGASSWLTTLLLYRVRILPLQNGNFLMQSVCAIDGA